MTSRSRKTAPIKRPEKMNLDKCLTLVLSTWGKDFCTSSQYKNLTDEERRESQSIVDLFTEMMLYYFKSTPPQWNEEYMEECCVRHFPRKVSEDPEYFRCIAPVLSAFFTYLDDQHLQPHAGAMAHAVQNLHEQIMEGAVDPKRWCFAKRLAMAARADGVDVTDAAAFHTYLVECNEKILKGELDPSIFRSDPMDLIFADGVKKTDRKR